MHFKSSLMVILTVLVLFSSLVTTVGFPTMTRVLAYESSSQAGLPANTCGNANEAFNILCQNLLSQIEGDGNAVNIIGLQTGGERTVSEETATIILSIIGKCVEGQECPGLPDPPPDSTITLTPGEYNLLDVFIPVVPDGLNLVSITKTEDCDSSANGPITAGEVRKCTLTFTYEPETP